MTDSEKKQDLVDLTKELVQASLNGIIELENKLGKFKAKDTNEYELFSNTLIAGLIFLKESNIDLFLSKDE